MPLDRSASRVRARLKSGASESEATSAEAKAAASRPARPGTEAAAQVGPAFLLGLQRSAGNEAVLRMLADAGGGSAQPRGTIQRLPSLSGVKSTLGLGKPKSPAARAEGSAAKATKPKSSPLTTKDLEKQITTLESATKRLVKAHQPGNADTQGAALKVKVAAEHILDNLPDQNAKSSKVLGRIYPIQVKRLRRVIDETGLIDDEARVAATKAQAQSIYLEAGRDLGSGKKGALTKLDATPAFADQQARPAQNAALTAWLAAAGFPADLEEALEKLHQMSDDELNALAKVYGSSPLLLLRSKQPDLVDYVEEKTRRDAGVALGLTPAEYAAIYTYTADDYLYINPATANSPDWMVKNHPDYADGPGKTDQERADAKAGLGALREEGTLHAGMAVESLLKLPVWQGTLYRGQGMTKERFFQQFKSNMDRTFSARGPITFNTLTSMTKNRRKAVEFLSVKNTGFYDVLFEMAVTNGRDVERLARGRDEREVAILPGAEFAVESIDVTGEGTIIDGKQWAHYKLTVKCRQTK